MDADQELLAVFRAEVDEQIEDLCALLDRAPGRWRADRLFQICHNVKGAARLVGADPVREVAHALEDLVSAIRDGLQPTPVVVELARSGARLLEACFRTFNDGPEGSAERPDIEELERRIRDLLRGETVVSDQQSGAAMTEATDRPGPADDESPDPAAAAAEPAPPPQEAASDSERHRGTDTVRVTAAKLDTLLGLSSELATQVFQLEGSTTLIKQAATQLEQATLAHAQLRSDIRLRETWLLLQELARHIEEQTDGTLRISEELQGSVRALRMVRFSGLRSLLSRSLRDACSSTGRSAVLRLTGGDTEIDRAVLEELRDPLVHLLRNTVAHGIEPESERTACGKEPAGTVELSARSAGPWVVVTVSDDGRGIDPAMVRERAVAGSKITSQEAETLSDEQVLDLLFLPGLSTVEKVSELAGRGVGLDVVRSHVTRLVGTVSMSSTFGKGTRVTLRLPLTRLTTSGIVVRLGEQLFAVPATDVERTILVRQRDVAVADGGMVVEIDGLWTRLTSLAGILGYPAADREEQPALVACDGPRRRAILVDEVLGQREYLAQQLPWNLRGTATLSGCAVLEGNQVVLVLDSRELIGSGRGAGAWSAQRTGRQRRLLVVDDSATSRTLEYNILKTAGYEVETAINGTEALQALQERPFDLVVSDVEMPGMNGLELVRRLRSEPELEHLPVVLVTSMGSEEDRQNGAEAGADAYIVKGDFDQDELLQTVARLL